MQNKSLLTTLCLILLGVLLAACSGTSVTPSAGDVETAVAGTLQALSDQALPATQEVVDPSSAPTETPQPTSTLLPTASPVQVLQQGSFVPFTPDECELVRAAFEQAIGASVTVETASFSDRVTGGTGTACRIHSEGNGTTYGMAGPYSALVTLLQGSYWTEDINYGAGGPTGMADGFRKLNALGLLSVTWQPSADANCPSNQPIGMCSLTPEQKLFTVNFDVARPVVYVPLPADQCSSWLATIQPAVPVTLVQETVEFMDLEWNTGTACQLHGAGTGLDFSATDNYPNTIGDIFVANGWTLVNGADGPNHTMREYTNGNKTAVLSFGWDPSADANCPSDQPISACVLDPQQKLYELTVAFGQK